MSIGKVGKGDQFDGEDGQSVVLEAIAHSLMLRMIIPVLLLHPFHFPLLPPFAPPRSNLQTSQAVLSFHSAISFGLLFPSTTANTRG